MLKRIDALRILPEKELIDEIYYVLDTVGNHPLFRDSRLTEQQLKNMIEFWLNAEVDIGTRDLTDEEAEIYDQWLNSESEKTGEKLF